MLRVAVMDTISHRDTVHMMKVCRLVQVHMLGGRPVASEMRRHAFHGGGRERLNRKAQREQHDEEEFAPVRHGYGV